MRALAERITFHLNRFLKYNPAAMATAASAAPRIGISVVPASEFPFASNDGAPVGLVGSPGDAGVEDPPEDDGDGTVSVAGLAVGKAVGILFKTATEKSLAASMKDNCSRAVLKETAFIAEDTRLSHSAEESQPVSANELRISNLTNHVDDNRARRRRSRRLLLIRKFLSFGFRICSETLSCLVTVLFTSSFCASVSEESCVVICIEPSNKIASAVLGTSVGNDDGGLVGLRVEVGRCEYEGTEVG